MVKNNSDQWFIPVLIIVDDDNYLFVAYII